VERKILAVDMILAHGAEILTKRMIVIAIFIVTRIIFKIKEL